MATKQPKATAASTPAWRLLRCGAEEATLDVEGRCEEVTSMDVKVRIPSSSVEVEVVRGRFVLLVSMTVVCFGKEVKVVVASEPPLPPPPSWPVLP
jgi:hypothetical protein